MSLGNFPFTRKSSINPMIAQPLRDHPYFTTKRFVDQTRMFKPESPETEYDRLVLSFLLDENYEYTDHIIEYWFQGQDVGGSLFVHCDYNQYARNDPTFNPIFWMQAGREKEFISPITIAAYIEISEDLEGGEFGIANKTCIDLCMVDPNKGTFAPEDIHYYKPNEYDVVYFHGSLYPHWIEPVTQGSRKSMLINFWPRNDK